MPFFYRITKPFATGVGGTTPGAVSSFSYVYTANSLEEYTCNSGNSIDFSWSAPSDDGGSAITGYVIRRIGVDWIEGTTGFSGVPDQLYDSNEFVEVCPFSDGTPTNPRILGNVTSYSYSGVECDYYSYEIAAINANGTGIYSNKSPTDYIAVGDDEITVTNLGEGSVEINYSSFSCVSGWAFVSVSGNLHNYEDAAFSGNIVDTYVDFDENNAGTIYFNGQSPGIYKVKIWETWSAEEEGSCTEQRHGCLEVPFEITS